MRRTNLHGACGGFYGVTLLSEVKTGFPVSIVGDTARCLKVVK